MNPYQILGVNPSATQDEIKSKYKSLAKLLHPDTNRDNPNASERFKEVNAAYDVLKDPQKRAQFDRSNIGGMGASARAGAQGRSQGPNGWRKHSYRSREFNFADFADFQAWAEANMHRDAFYDAPPRRSRTNEDKHGEHRISLANAYTGCTQTITINYKGGAQKKAQLHIPPGIYDGTRLRLQGLGEKIFSDLPAGDLYIRVFVDNDPFFERVKDDLFYDIRVDAIDAIIGATQNMVLPDKTVLPVNIPPGVQHDQKIRVSGKGMPIQETDQRGDLYLRVKIRIPTAMSEPDKALLRKIKTGDAKTHV